MDEVRFVFHVICSDYPEMAVYLGLKAHVTECPQFESGVVKILGNDEHGMDDIEKEAASCLRTTSVGNITSSKSKEIFYFE